MKCIIGLGNPEARYDGTRHNVGFAVLDEYARQQGCSWKESKRFKGLVAELPDRTLLVKPTTYYNLVGESARAVADFYKLSPENILVVHDELALPFGTLRTRERGSAAGNNGIKSLNAHLGPNYNRLRIGTYSQLKDRADASDFVLAAFSADERDTLAHAIVPEAIRHMNAFIDGKFAPTKTVV